MAEREGFEPSVPRKKDNGFRDRPVRPLRHLSTERDNELPRARRDRQPSLYIGTGCPRASGMRIAGGGRRRHARRRRSRGAVMAANAARRIGVIGAGMIGVCVTSWLQRDGHSVFLIEPGNPGEGASFGNAGCFNGSSVL